MRPGHIRPFKVMAMASLRLANLPTKIHILYCLQRCIGQFGLKLCLGNRPCPIAYSAFKCVRIITKFSILLPNTLISVTTLSF